MRIVPLALCLVALSPGTALAAKPAVLKGEIKGLSAPAGGEARLETINLATGVVASSVPISAKGRYRVSVPAGRYGFVAYSVRLGRQVDKAIAAMKLKAGKTRTQSLLLKAPKKKAGRAAQSGFGDVSVAYPAIAVQRFSVIGGGADEQQLARGEANMTITDLANIGGCERKVAVVEREHLQDILREIGRGRDPRFDPASAPRSGRIIRDNASVGGTIAFSGGLVTISSTYTERNTGYETTVTESGPASDYFAIRDRASAKLVKRICKPEQPGTAPSGYQGSFSGTYTTETTNLSVTWSGGTLQFGKHTEDGFSDTYEVVSGSVPVTVSFPGQNGSCSLNGTEVVDMVGISSLSVEKAAGPPYFLAVGFPPSAAVTVTRSDCSDPAQNGTTEEHSLSGLRAAGSNDRQTGSSGTLSGSNTSNQPGVGAITSTWSFSPLP